MSRLVKTNAYSLSNGAERAAMNFASARAPLRVTFEKRKGLGVLIAPEIGVAGLKAEIGL